MRRLAAIITAILLGLVAARCSRDVDLGVDPASVASDGGANDGPGDTSAAE